jgi:hypothetical protein
MRGKSALRRHAALDRVQRRLKHDEKAVTLGAHLLPAAGGNAARSKARWADSASPYRSPRPRSNIVEPSMSLNSIVIVPVGNSPCPDYRPTMTAARDM